MAIDYTIFPEEKLICVKYSGVFNKIDIVNARKFVSEDKDYNPVFNVIEDVSAVEEVDANFDELSKLSPESIMQKDIKHCIVAVTELQFAMSRMYQMLAEYAGHEIHIFKSLEEAKSWISA